jgi:hypothetical protein
MHPCVFEGNTTILLNELKLRNEGLGFRIEKLEWSEEGYLREERRK